MCISEPVDIVTDPQHQGWRAVVVLDSDAGQPWGDALAPALILGRHNHVEVAAEVYQPPQADRIVAAWRHFADHTLFARYLRQCHGITAIVSAGSGDTTVLIFDTGDYRAHVGITGVADLSGERAEWQAWFDCDVYGVIVEQRAAETRCAHCGHHEPARWVEVDACWGFYGHRSAASRALDLLRDAAVDAAPAVAGEGR